MIAYLIDGETYNKPFPLVGKNPKARIHILPFKKQVQSRKPIYYYKAADRIYRSKDFAVPPDFREMVQKAINISGLNEEIPLGSYSISNARGYLSDEPVKTIHFFDGEKYVQKLQKTYPEAKIDYYKKEALQIILNGKDIIEEVIHYLFGMPLSFFDGDFETAYKNSEVRDKFNMLCLNKDIVNSYENFLKICSEVEMQRLINNPLDLISGLIVRLKLYYGSDDFAIIFPMPPSNVNRTVELLDSLSINLLSLFEQFKSNIYTKPLESNLFLTMYFKNIVNALKNQKQLTTLVNNFKEEFKEALESNKEFYIKINSKEEHEIIFNGIISIESYGKDTFDPEFPYYRIRDKELLLIHSEKKK
jgi:hypothetical protein